MKRFVVRLLEAVGYPRPLMAELWWMIGLGMVAGSLTGPFWIGFPLFAAGYSILAFQRKP